jgi:hypothetical protein
LGEEGGPFERIDSIDSAYKISRMATSFGDSNDTAPPPGSRNRLHARVPAPLLGLAVVAACWRPAENSWRADSPFQHGVGGCTRVPLLWPRSRLRGGFDATETAELWGAEEGPKQFSDLRGLLQEVSFPVRLSRHAFRV